MRKRLVGILSAAVMISSMFMMTASAAEDHMIKATGKFTKLDKNGTAFIGYNINGFDAYPYKFVAGDKLEYEVYLETEMSGLGHLEIQGSKLQSTDAEGNEVHDWKYLRMTGVSDQDGLEYHPATDLSAVAYKQWYKRTIEIPASFERRHIQACSTRTS